MQGIRIDTPLLNPLFTHTTQPEPLLQTAVAQATTTAFQSARQAFEIEQAQATARREQAITAAVTILVGITAVFVIGLFVIFIWRIIPTLISRAGIVRYVQHGNPLLLMGKDGRIISG